ncbi:hypothetical protein IQ254_05340 [Nodosilinea sp. LEGE 07088]|uniref:nSTAND1 domain-containing NTPase n=1 Tax=Nodosilinea sp. LEGE 07088 TaxID=2777968 RepID=UPI001880451A|nr:hypothetical protein [Nodosilinea sp. LEGE 07088]MBE9136630.1 hypothetical protein [Nodosilinea sp. LEGE 07088]
MTEGSRQPGSDSRQSQDLQIGRDFQVEGSGHRVDFSQTHIETQIIQQTSVAAVQSRPLITASPYKGLKKFEATDRERFFGRESLISDLLTHLTTHRCLILLGASGSGKSSLVRAGIIPKLLEAQGTNLIDLTLTPDEDPFDSLYASLLGHFKQAEARLARLGAPNTLVQVVQQLQAPSTPWVIFVDQFEELFTISHPQKREAFITSLVNLQRWMAEPQEKSALGAGSRSLYLILAMRADFLDQFAPYRGLGQLTERYLRFITNMTREDLQRAIANPANLHGVAYQEGLLKEILNDLQGQPGELPLLQYTLDLLWKSAHLEDRLICCDTYWAIEGVQGALRRHVNEIYDQLSPADQRRARQIFLSLVDMSARRDNPEGPSKAVSRRAYVSQFADPETRRVLIHLIDANLLVSNWRRATGDAQDQAAIEARPQDEDLNDEAASSRATVELAHETLIRSWSRLQTWLEENQAVINLKHRLSDEARHWHTLTQTDPDKAVDELWRGSKLEQVVELQHDGVFDALFGGLDAAETEFIQAATDERDRQHREQEERRQQELRLYRNLAMSAGIALVVILGLGTAATLGWRSAQRQEIEALITAADASFIANRHSLDTLVAALEAGDRLQKSFWFRGDPNLRTDTLQVVSQAVYWVREQGSLSGHEQYVEGVAVNPNDSPKDQIATAGRDGTVRLWTPDGDETDTLIEQDVPFSYIAFNPDGSRLAMADYEGKVALWSRQGGALQTLGNAENSHQKAVRSISFHPTEPRLATASDDGTVKIWDFNSQLLDTLSEHRDAVNAVAYSPDGKFLVTGGDDQAIILWDSDGNLRQTIGNLPSPISHLSFSTGSQWLIDGIWLAIAMENGIVEIRQFDPNRPALLSPEIILSSHAAEVTAVQFHPGGTLIATASVDGTAKIWSRNGKELLTLKGHTDRLNGLDFNASGTLLTTASNDRTVKLWNLDPPHQRILSGHFDNVHSVDFSADNKLLATAGKDGRILVWDIETTHQASPKVLQAGASVRSMKISPDSRYLAGAFEDGTIKLWSIVSDGSQDSLFTIAAHGEDQVSGVQFSADSQTLISAGYDSAVRFWQLPDGTLQNTLQNPEQDIGEIYALSLSQDTNLLVTANHAGTASIWRLDTQQVTTIQAHKQPVLQAMITPDKQILITSSVDNSIKLQGLSSNFEQTLTGHEAGVWGMDVSADSQLIASGSDDGTAIIWTTEGDRLLKLTGHREAINTVNFSSDRHWLATGSADDTVMLWDVKDVSLQSFLEQGCNWLNQNHHDSRSKLSNKIQHLCPMGR